MRVGSKQSCTYAHVAEQGRMGYCVPGGPKLVQGCVQLLPGTAAAAP